MNTNKDNNYNQGTSRQPISPVTFGDETNCCNRPFNPNGLRKESSGQVSFQATSVKGSNTEKVQPASNDSMPSSNNNSMLAATNGSSFVPPFFPNQSLPPLQYTNCNLNVGEIANYSMKRYTDVQVESAKSTIRTNEEEEKTKIRINAAIERDALSIKVEEDLSGFLVLRHSRLHERDLTAQLIDHKPEIVEQFVSSDDPDDRLIHVLWVRGSHKRDMYFDKDWSPQKFLRELSVLGIHFQRLKGIKCSIEETIRFLIELSERNKRTIPTKYGVFTENGESVYVSPDNKEIKLWKEYKRLCER